MKILSRILVRILGLLLIFTLAQSEDLPDWTGMNDDESAENSYVNKYEYMYKTIIRLYRPDRVELIDLHQVGDLAKPSGVLFDSSAEREKNDRYLEYKDTDEDAVLMSGYSKLLRLELGLATDSDALMEAIFEHFIQGANQDKSLQLLNTTANRRFDTDKNFEKLVRSTLYERYDVSRVLDLETSYDRMYIKTPEYILLVLIDDCYFSQKAGGWWIFRRSSEFVSFKTRYKIYSLKDKKVIRARKYTFSFAIDKNAQDKYAYIAQNAGDKLKSHFAGIMKNIKQ